MQPTTLPWVGKVGKGWLGGANHVKASNSKHPGVAVGKLAHIVPQALPVKRDKDPKADGILWRKMTPAVSSAAEAGIHRPEAPFIRMLL